MKDPIKKLLAIATVMAMVLSLAACGGSGSGSSEAPAEANTGVAGIVFSVPEDWTVDGGQSENYISYSAGDYRFGVSVFTDGDLEDRKKMDSSVTSSSVEEYYKQDNSASEEELKAQNLERSDIEVCGESGNNYKLSNKNGVAGRTLNFLHDGKYYMMYLSYDQAYGEDGNIRDDIPAMPSDLQSTFDNIIASIQPGDGEALLSNILSTVNSIGSIAFEVPEGYSLISFTDKHVSLTKDGSEAVMMISLTEEEDLQWIEDENGNHPESVEAEFKSRSGADYGAEKIDVAGHEAYKSVDQSENGPYMVDTVFMADNVMYDVNMDAQAFDDDGNIKEGAAALTKEELGAYDSLLASIKAK